MIGNIEATWHASRVGAEGFQPAADQIPVEPQRPDCSDGRHRIFDLKAQLALARERDIRQCEAVLDIALDRNDRTTVLKDNPVATHAMRCHERMMSIAGKECDRPGTGLRHLCDQWVGRIQDGHALGGDVANDHSLDIGKLRRCFDEIHTKMVTATNVGHDGHIAAIEGQALAQHPTARRFKDGGIHIRVCQHATCANGSAAITRINATPIDPDPVGSRHANPMAD